MQLFILTEDHQLIETDDAIAWGEWHETHKKECQVASEVAGNYLVSTMFLGLNMHLFGQVPPVVFETAVFEVAAKPELGSLHIFRSSTWDDAEKLHAKTVARFRELRP